MFWKLTVSVPCVQGKIRIKTNGSGHRYVEYEVGRNYDKEKEKNVPTRKTIDLLDDGEVSERKLVHSSSQRTADTFMMMGTRVA